MPERQAERYDESPEWEIEVDEPHDVTTAIEIVERDLDRLRDALGRLGSRLEPVLGASTPHAVAEEATVRFHAPLAVRIQELSGLLRSMLGHVEGLSQRVAL